MTPATELKASLAYIKELEETFLPVDEVAFSRDLFKEWYRLRSLVKKVLEVHDSDLEMLLLERDSARLAAKKLESELAVMKAQIQKIQSIRHDIVDSWPCDGCIEKNFSCTKCEVIKKLDKALSQGKEGEDE